MKETTFWETLPRPIIGLSPMHGVTDHPFRHIQKKYGDPMLTYTEFVSVEGVCTGDVRILRQWLYDESQRPVIAQVFGHTPDWFRQTAVALCQMGFDGIDINMGCPTRSVAQRGAGAALIKTPGLAQEIVRAVKEGVRDWREGADVRDCPDIPDFLKEGVQERHRALPLAARKRRPIPVSVKTRIGYEEERIRDWIPWLLESEPAAIAIHGRTLRQAYSGEADWAAIGAAADLAQGTETLILGNGDIRSLEDARERIARYGLDGALIGRASYGNPFVFRDPATWTRPADPYFLLRVALEHARLYEASFRNHERYQFSPMRKHLGWYAHDVPSAKSLRRELTQTNNVEDVVAVLDRYFAYRKQWEQR